MFVFSDVRTAPDIVPPFPGTPTTGVTGTTGITGVAGGTGATGARGRAKTLKNKPGKTKGWANRASYDIGNPTPNP